MSTMHRFAFDFDPAYRVAALPLGITPRTAYVEVGPAELRVRFGPWSLRTALGNIRSTSISGGYALLKTIGPPHLSFADRGITFATNGRRGVCLELVEPVPGISPGGFLKHPGVTLTVADPEGLVDAVTP